MLYNLVKSRNAFLQKREKKMEKEIVEIICKNLKWYECLIVKLNKTLFMKIYNNIRGEIIKAMLL